MSFFFAALLCLLCTNFAAKFVRMDIDAYIAELRQRLAGCRLTREQVACRTGGALSASWISKFASGNMSNPRAASLKALDAVLRDWSALPITAQAWELLSDAERAGLAQAESLRRRIDSAK